MDANEPMAFLGYNDCTRRVLEKLDRHERVEPDVRIVTERQPADYPWLTHVHGDFAAGRVIDRIAWNDIELAVIFHEGEEGRTPAEGDIRTMTTALQIPESIPLVAEIIDEDYTEIFRADIPQQTDLVYKERLDADLIANTIVHPGASSRFFQKLVGDPGHHLRALSPNEIVAEMPSTVERIRRTLLDDDGVRLLAVAESDGTADVNPSLDTKVTDDDLLYCMVEQR